jgi:hypothetical protein
MAPPPVAPAVRVRVSYTLTNEDLVHLLAYHAYRHGIRDQRPSRTRILDLVRHILRHHGDAELEGWADGADDRATAEVYQWAESVIADVFLAPEW